MVDDDREDIYLTKRAFCAKNSNLEFRSVQSGNDLFDYLNCRGEYAGHSIADMPDVILLDINIPRENGFALLEKIKADTRYSHLPVSMLTTSKSSSDVHKAYQLGASSFICKSTSADGMRKIADIFCAYWLSLAELPHVQ